MKLKNFLLPFLLCAFSILSCNTCEEKIWFQDADFDGLGNPEETQTSCERPVGYVSNSDDEDDDCFLRNWYFDFDFDGYGSNDSIIVACEEIYGFVENNDDPDDDNPSLTPQNVWQGAKITFTKVNNSDYLLEKNQDKITDGVILTRDDFSDLLNIAASSSASALSPINTLWAFGSTNRIDTLNFSTLKIKTENCINCTLDKPMVLYLQEENIYIDIKFKAWSENGIGNGMSYQRSTSIF